MQRFVRELWLYSVHAMYCECLFIFFAGLLVAQPSATIPAGGQAEIELVLSSPHIAPGIDILANGGKNIDIEVVLADGTRVKHGEFERTGISFEELPIESIDEHVMKCLIAGSGTHFVLGLAEAAPNGNYTLRIHNLDPTRAVAVRAQFCRIELVIDSLQRATKGIKIVGPLKGSSNARSVRLQLRLQRSSEESLIDVASTAERISVRLSFPDGTVVTKETAATRGVDWEELSYPLNLHEAGEDPFGGFFAAAFMLSLRPVFGSHHLITFPSGVPQEGIYRIEVDGPGTGPPFEVSVMFVPEDALSLNQFQSQQI
jgi:hypothetical protein